MKKFNLVFLVLSFLAVTTAFAAEIDGKRPTLSISQIGEATNDIVIMGQEIFYDVKAVRVDLWARFTADFAGNLKSIRVVRSDHTVYEGTKDAAETEEVMIDWKAWEKHFRAKIALPAIRMHHVPYAFSRDQRTYEIVGVDKVDQYVLKDQQGGIQIIPQADFYFIPPQKIKFQLGVTDDKFVALVTGTDAGTNKVVWGGGL